MDTKLIDRTAVKKAVARLKKSGKKIVFTNGCFDLIHPGHIKLLREARAQGDCLILGLNSDESIRSIKDPRRPILDQDERIAVLSELVSIDHIVLFDEQTPLKLIEEIVPDVLVKGGDWDVNTIVGADVVKKNGGNVVVVDLKQGDSTTSIIKRIVEKYGNNTG
jgi:rfaE bifunctional protein nucleotidyltransferase chain/domain